MYVVALLASVALARLLPHLFVSPLTVRLALTAKLPIAVLAFGLVVYPPVVFVVARWLRQQRSGRPGLFAN